jgi:hypothetical protein
MDLKDNFLSRVGQGGVSKRVTIIFPGFFAMEFSGIK